MPTIAVDRQFRLSRYCALSIADRPVAGETLKLRASEKVACCCLAGARVRVLRNNGAMVNFLKRRGIGRARFTLNPDFCRSNG